MEQLQAGTQAELPFEVPTDLGADLPRAQVSTDDLKLAVCRLLDAKNNLDEKEEIRAVASKQHQECQAHVLALLEQAELESFKVPGVGTATRSDSLSFTTPKSNDEKRQFFKLVQEKFGDEGFWGYVTVNSRTLQTLCKELIEGGMNSIPGIESPVAMTKLSFTKERAKKK